MYDIVISNMSNGTLDNNTITCPRSFDCSDRGFPDLVSFSIGRVPSYATISSCGLSVLGSLLIVVAYCALKDMRTGAQKIVTLLAIADFVSAAGYIIGSINFLVHFDEDDEAKCKVFTDICVAQASFTSWSSIASFCWTVILAVYFSLVIVYKKSHLAARLMPLYNLIAWGAPALIIIPLAATGKLGFTPYATSNWCYVKDTDYNISLKSNTMTVFTIFIAGKFWEIISYIIVTIIYIQIILHISKTKRLMPKSTQMEPKVVQVEKRLLAIPLLFILLRIWGTLQVFVALAVSGTVQDGCIPSAVRKVFFALGILQAIGDGGQGWGNAILYIFLSPTIRDRLFCEARMNCMDACEDRMQKMLANNSDDNEDNGELEQNSTTSSRRSRSRSNRQQQQQQQAKNSKAVGINVLHEATSETLPLIATSPATGYSVRKYDTTSCTDGNTTAS